MSAFTAGFWMWLGKEAAELLSWILTIVFMFIVGAVITGLIAIADRRHDQAKRGNVK